MHVLPSIEQKYKSIQHPKIPKLKEKVAAEKSKTIADCGDLGANIVRLGRVATDRGYVE